MENLFLKGEIKEEEKGILKKFLYDLENFRLLLYQMSNGFPESAQNYAEYKQKRLIGKISKEEPNYLFIRGYLTTVLPFVLAGENGVAASLEERLTQSFQPYLGEKLEEIKKEIFPELKKRLELDRFIPLPDLISIILKKIPVGSP